VTVVAPDGMTADWLDTAVSVMEPAQALALVERIPGAAARITMVDERGRSSVIESKRYRDLRATPARGSTGPAAAGK
jgi:thiamine biosynthesis lipoprotein